MKPVTALPHASKVLHIEIEVEFLAMLHSNAIDLEERGVLIFSFAAKRQISFSKASCCFVIT